jgi:ubiquinone/menaquinone biosynthesis C-methylase UbiE
VSAIDLTPEFVELARLLTVRCSLSEKIDYRQGSALALPFEAASFDHVWCDNVIMNIADRKTLVREVARVLRSNGCFSCVEAAQGKAGPPSFPLPWASDSSTSFLVRPEEMGDIGSGRIAHHRAARFRRGIGKTRCAAASGE